MIPLICLCSHGRFEEWHKLGPLWNQISCHFAPENLTFVFFFFLQNSVGFYPTIANPNEKVEVTIYMTTESLGHIVYVFSILVHFAAGIWPGEEQFRMCCQVLGDICTSAILQACRDSPPLSWWHLLASSLCVMLPTPLSYLLLAQATQQLLLQEAMCPALSCFVRMET